eukprot:2065077-Pleurochrysis_carterae.AAC.4
MPGRSSTFISRSQPLQYIQHDEENDNKPYTADALQNAAAHLRAFHGVSRDAGVTAESIFVVGLVRG